MRKLVSSITILCFCINFISCGLVETEPCQIKVKNQEVATKKQETVKESSDVKIDSIELFCWWWSEEQMRNSHLFDDDKQPPKNTYTKFEEWVYGDVNFLHPEKFDIVANIENGTEVTQNLIVEAEISFKIEPVVEPVTDEEIKEQQKQNLPIEETPWTEKESLKSQKVTLASKEKKEIVFKDYILWKTIEKYADDRFSHLWPYQMKVRIFVKSAKGNAVIEGEKIIEIVPAD